jgi:hypothetical protein
MWKRRLTKAMFFFHSKPSGLIITEKERVSTNYDVRRKSLQLTPEGRKNKKITFKRVWTHDPRSSSRRGDRATLVSRIVNSQKGKSGKPIF